MKLSLTPGDVPSDCRSLVWDDGQLDASASLLRRYHDATASIAGADEVVCHNDFGPWNLVWHDGASDFVPKDATLAKTRCSLAHDRLCFPKRRRPRRCGDRVSLTMQRPEKSLHTCRGPASIRPLRRRPRTAS
jgi:hypothetical protein